MLFNFCITEENDSATYGVCSANDLEEAKKMVAAEVGDNKFDIDHGVEDLINEQYGGLAFLTTDRGC